MYRCQCHGRVMSWGLPGLLTRLLGSLRALTRGYTLAQLPDIPSLRDAVLGDGTIRTPKNQNQKKYVKEPLINSKSQALFQVLRIGNRRSTISSSQNQNQKKYVKEPIIHNRRHHKEAKEPEPEEICRGAFNAKSQAS
ncbi:hypothetical protein RRG08_002908 [Elysia crispata]|uniref:Uncharacterized protein n=1 Tax=Elysia crispata TaxID=231223 RepID=A0AAE1E264_9GAST|nr:hypothetical protein RRG08_002908 [Elysia crispata]